MYGSVFLSGSNAIAGSANFGTNTGLYYSTDYGANWSQSNVTTGVFYSIILSGSNGIAGSYSGNGLYYTTNGGQTWTQSNINASSNIRIGSLGLSGSNVIAGCASITNLGIYYSTNLGVFWTQSNLTSGKFVVALSGLNAIAGSTSNTNLGLYYSTNGGQTWIQSNITSGNFQYVSLSGLNGIAGSYSNLGLYYTTNGGQTWTQSNITTGTFNSVFLSGSNAIAGAESNGSRSGLYYSTNSGQTWIQSNIISGSFNYLNLAGTEGIAGSSSNAGVYTTRNAGKTWVQSNINSGSNYPVSIDISSHKAIVGSESPNTGIYYSSGPICYEKNTLILVVENDIEVYKKVSELKVGDVVKTYKHGNKKIKIIKSFKYNFINAGSIKNCLFKMRNHDIIVTGRHGILVDKLTDEEKEEIKRIQTKIRYIDDKVVLPACASDKFERISNDQEYELWHFALENDDVNANYGVYINDGILSESCSEAVITNQ